VLFRNDIEPCCSYCIHGTDMGRGEIACRNCGIMAASGKCSLFRYEPTKREPEFAHSLNVIKLSEEDFAL